MVSDDDKRTFLIGQLQHAHAMERAAIDITAAMLKRLEHYPEVEERLRQHLEETRRQAERLERALARFDAKPSTAKDLVGRFASLNSLVNVGADDEIIRHGAAGIAFEHLEIATYRALATLADFLAEEELAMTIREILAEEEAMAAWLSEHLDEVGKKFLMRWVRGDRGEAAA